jgi:hypothetical protein
MKNALLTGLGIGAGVAIYQVLTNGILVSRYFCWRILHGHFCGLSLS